MAKPYEVIKGMTNPEGPKPKKHNTDLRNSKAKLPWWVEILFVQIGLPESLLREILKLKNKSFNHYSNNRKKYYLSAFAIATFIYTYPIIKYTSNNNRCVRETLDYLSKKEIEKVGISVGKKVVSVNYCNGGSYLIFD